MDGKYVRDFAGNGCNGGEYVVLCLQVKESSNAEVGVWRK